MSTIAAKAGTTQKKGIVPTMIDAADRTNIETYPVRRGISVNADLLAFFKGTAKAAA